MNKVNKILIPVIAATETLTLFPLFFFGIYTLVESGNLIQKEYISLMGVLLIGIAYIFSVLFGSYLAIRNISKPLKAYLILSIPVLIGVSVLLYRN